MPMGDGNLTIAVRVMSQVMDFELAKRKDDLVLGEVLIRARNLLPFQHNPSKRFDKSYQK